MDAGAVNVRSEFLTDLEIALGRFSIASLERLKQVQAGIRRVADQVEDRRRELRREMESLRQEIEEADDDDDTTTATRHFEETEEKFETIRRCQIRLELSVENYVREARKLEELSNERTAAARAYLRGLVQDLGAYFTLQKQGAADAAVSAPQLSSVLRKTGGENQAGFDPTSFSLPPGYKWIAISEIDTAGELKDVQDQAAYEKVPYQEMRRGFDALRNDVLPALSGGNLAPAEVFARRDAKAGVSYEHGLERVYDAFFGNDPIYLSRGADTELCTVTSGRHRIKAAIDAGWTAVPVKMGARNV